VAENAEVEVDRRFLTREEFRLYLLQKHNKKIKESFARINQQMLRWDIHHTNGCACAPEGLHGVRLDSENWLRHRTEELIDADSYEDFEAIWHERQYADKFLAREKASEG
jgi:hypothetical protein